MLTQMGKGWATEVMTEQIDEDVSIIAETFAGVLHDAPDLLTDKTLEEIVIRKLSVLEATAQGTLPFAGLSGAVEARNVRAAKKAEVKEAPEAKPAEVKEPSPEAKVSKKVKAERPEVVTK